MPHHSHSHAQTNAASVLRPWSPTFQPGNASFETLDGRPVTWNGGWAGIAGETGTQSAPAPLQSKQGDNAGPTYLPFPELTCLHCLGSNPPGKLGYVVSYLPVVPAGSGAGSSIQQQQQQPEKQTPATVATKVNGAQSQAQTHQQTAEDSDTSHGEGQDGYHPLPVRSPAPAQSALIASRTGRESLRSDQRARRARSRAEERVQDIERGRQLEKEEQAERARSSSVSWELAGVSKRYVPDGEEGDEVIE